MSEGQRPTNKQHVSVLEARFLKNIHVQLATFGVWVNETKEQLAKIGREAVEKKMNRRIHHSTRKPEQWIEAALKAPNSGLKKYVFGGQHGTLALQRGLPKLESHEEQMASQHLTTVYCNLELVQKQMLCKEHNEVASLHEEVTDSDK